MLHRNTKQLLSFALCLAVLFLCSTVYYAVEAHRYEQQALYSGQRAAAQLIGSLESMKTVMDALPYTADTSLFPQTAAQLSQHASAAAAALAALNLQDARLERTGTYLNQAGDLARALLVQHLAGFELEQDQLAQLEQLCGGMEPLLETARDIKLRLNAGVLSPGDLYEADPEWNSAMAALEQLAPEEPLVYDGLYGKAAVTEALGLSGLEDVTQEHAAQAAAQLAGRQLPLVGELSAPVAAWCFGDEGCYAAVTKQGGLVLHWLMDEPEGSPALSMAEAEQIAADLVEGLGFAGLQTVERHEAGDRCLLTFAPVVDGVEWLPDGVTVTVSLVNGDVLALEAQDYLLYHTAREQGADLLTPEQAQASLPDGMTVQQGHLSLVQSPGGRELLCYSFVCATPEGDGLRILVRADNGALWDLEPQPEQNE